MKSFIVLFIKILPVAVVLLVIVEIIITNELVHYGKSVQTINNSIVLLQHANENLAQRVASASSLVAIEQKAISMGLVPPSFPIILGQEEFALRNQ